MPAPCIAILPPRRVDEHRWGRVIDGVNSDRPNSALSKGCRGHLGRDARAKNSEDRRAATRHGAGCRTKSPKVSHEPRDLRVRASDDGSEVVSQNGRERAAVAQNGAQR